MATAKVIGADAATAAVLSELGGIFALKKNKQKYRKLFRFTPDWLKDL